jgi:hypothetical protein
MRPPCDSPANDLAHQAVEALFLIEREIRSAISMRQQALFPEVDRIWLEGTRKGMVTVVLRVALVLFAEAKGILPLQDPSYRETLALTPLPQGPSGHAWKRLLRLSEILSGEKAPPAGVRAPAWKSNLFHASWLGTLAPQTPDPSASIALSDEAVQQVIQTLSRTDQGPIPFPCLLVENVSGLYERLIGFELVRCKGRSYRWGSNRLVVDLDHLLATTPEDRVPTLVSQGGKPNPSTARKLTEASSFEEILAALRGRRRGETLPPGSAVLQPTLARRRSGSHYTPKEVVCDVVRHTLAPLVRETCEDSEGILSLRVCDPSMGTGAFLAETCRQLAEVLVAAWGSTDEAADETPDRLRQRARCLIASRCLYGVDLDPFAVELARVSLQLTAECAEGNLPSVSANLRWGNAVMGTGPWIAPPEEEQPDPCLVGLDWISGKSTASRDHARARRSGSERPRPMIQRLHRVADECLHDFLEAHEATSPAQALLAFRGRALRDDRVAPYKPTDTQPRPWMAREADSVAGEPANRPFHWPLEFPEVFLGPRPGFDAFVGNPPWVAYAGRAAQPLPHSHRAYFLHVSAAFRGYRTLQALFVHRCASLLREGGRLGLVLPTSMSDLEGYAPVRRVHDVLCEADPDLPDFGGHAFDGVFQPSMALLSTRRNGMGPVVSGVWSVHRDDLPEWAGALLERLARLPRVPETAFSERGFQSMREDGKRFRSQPEPQGSFTVAVREGADVRAFRALPPRLYLDPTGLGGRLRSADQFAQVSVLLRQTARYPIAALSDGCAFRNSVLAGFAFDGWPAGALVAYLNAWPLRWLHYMRHRDARQGMPQVKISHLRSLPAPMLAASDVEALDAMGRDLSLRKEDIDENRQRALDVLVARVLGIRSNELDAIERWQREGGPR